MICATDQLVRWLALVCLSACSQTPEASKKRPPPLVQVARPTLRDVDVTLGYTVDIRPIEQADLQSKVSGYVEKIYVDRGDLVKKGQLLADIRPSDLPEQVAAAREQATQSEAGWKLAQQNAQRARELFQREMISKAELDQAEAQLAMAQAAHGASRSSLGAMSTRLSETRLVAPFTGWVARRNLDPGALVQPGPQNATILTVVKIDQVRVFVSVLEQQAPLVRRGQTARIIVDALPGKSFEGRVTRVPPALDVNTRTLETEIVIPNPDQLLKPGMYGRAELSVDHHPRAVVLPVEAVIAEEKERSVYVVRDIKDKIGVVHRVPVEVGFDGGDWLEIARGLTGEEDVVVAGVDLVSDGTPVSVARKDKAVASGQKSPAPKVD
jgi:membrane fusion protein (multidrug efflux system)